MILETAVANLLSPPVLAFLLGVIAVAVRSDLRVPEALTKTISLYLLLAIGLKGGMALREATFTEVIGPLVLSLLLGVAIPFVVFIVLGVVSRLGPVDRGSVAAHYGSTSLVTFTAALVFLESLAIEYPGYAPALLTVLEIPGIVVGIVLASRASTTGVRWGAALHEVFAGTSIFLLTGGLLLGLIVGETGYAGVRPFFEEPFRGVLALFLLSLGIEAGQRFGSLRHAGYGVLVFAAVFPFVVGSAVAAIAVLAGMGQGGAVVLAILCGSASYIAAPAAVRLALPDANLAVPLAASIGVTFPINLALGIPYLTWLSAVLTG
ncbi:MAG: sodium-dependent bicarbonate transport family permease [Microcella sp.]|uniref:sodium-dependent bicarbonate transport family permease n=1 Tax=Microcella sp. TaxID=1913979 RepID=UPI0024C6A04F|nr:sodium-dependent bicarbonate transport family permease [Microcella sp.]UYN83499.1 MAG: sodium-dependent bicarbonate transport family permease [Microcella sp.]